MVTHSGFISNANQTSLKSKMWNLIW